MDMNRIKLERLELEERIRELKAELRSCWTRPMGNDQLELLGCQRQATELYCLIAWSRGRHHLQDIELCRKIVERRMPEYTLEAA